MSSLRRGLLKLFSQLSTSLLFYHLFSIRIHVWRSMSRPIFRLVTKLWWEMASTFHRQPTMPSSLTRKNFKCWLDQQSRPNTTQYSTSDRLMRGHANKLLKYSDVYSNKRGFKYRVNSRPMHFHRVVDKNCWTMINKKKKICARDRVANNKQVEN